MAINVEPSDPIRAAATTKANHDEDGDSRGQEPVIIDLGKKSRKQVRKLRKGKPGRLMRRVEETVDHLRAGGELGDNIRPIIIVVRERVRRRKGSRRAAKMFGMG